MKLPPGMVIGSKMDIDEKEENIVSYMHMGHKMELGGQIPCKAPQVIAPEITQEVPTVLFSAEQIQEIHQKATAAHMNQKLKRLYTLECKYEPEAYRSRFVTQWSGLFSKLDRLEDLDANSGVSSKDTEAYFITINPDFGSEGFDLDVFIQKVETFVTRKWVSIYYYTFEQGGSTEENMGTHPHVHMLVFLDKSKQQSQPARFREAVKRTFKQFCDTSNSIFCNIKALTADKVEPRRLYILGNKKGADKKAKQTIDYEWRIAENLNPYYTNYST